MGDFKQLRAWREAKRLAVLSKAAIGKLPSEERYALGDQWRRAVYSVALNLAEGASRRGPREFRRYLDISRASLHELEAIFELAAAQGYFTDVEMTELRVTRANCARLVYGLLRRMSDRAR
jgi:four helix bundle protein